MRRFIYIMIVFLTSGICFTSCRSIKYVPVETIRTEYRNRDSIRVDSIYNQDSIYILIKGDTIYQYRYKYLYKYQFLNKTDTVIKTDSVQVPYPVEKCLSRWETIKMELGGWGFGIIILLVICLLFKFIKYRTRS